MFADSKRSWNSFCWPNWPASEDDKAVLSGIIIEGEFFKIFIVIQHSFGNAREPFRLTNCRIAGMKFRIKSGSWFMWHFDKRLVTYVRLSCTEGLGNTGLILYPQYALISWKMAFYLYLIYHHWNIYIAALSGLTSEMVNIMLYKLHTVFLLCFAWRMWH